MYSTDRSPCKHSIFAPATSHRPPSITKQLCCCAPSRPADPPTLILGLEVGGWHGIQHAHHLQRVINLIRQGRAHRLPTEAAINCHCMRTPKSQTCPSQHGKQPAHKACGLRCSIQQPHLRLKAQVDACAMTHAIKQDQPKQHCNHEMAAQLACGSKPRSIMRSASSSTT